MTIRAGETSVPRSSASASVSGPATTSSKRSAAAGSSPARRGEGPDQRRRVAAVAAEAARVDERGSRRVEQLVAVVPGPAGSEIRVPAVGDQRGLDPEPVAQVVGGRAADADDRVRAAQPAPLQPAIEAALERRWGTRGRSGSKVQPSRTSASHGTPRRASARPTRCTDSGGELVITQSNRPRRRSRSAVMRANGAHATASGSGTISLRERVRPAAVGVGVEQGVDPVPAVQARADELQVAGPHHVGLAVRAFARTPMWSAP